MQTATAAPAAPLHQLLAAAPVLTALAVDFRRNQWTFSLPAQPVGPGEYLVVRAEDVRAALDEPAAAPLTTLLHPVGALHVRYEEHTRIGRGFGCRTLVIRDEDGEFDATLWGPHCPDAGEEETFRRGVWYGSEERRGSDGAVWARRLTMVCDDFGTLVPVQR